MTTTVSIFGMPSGGSPGWAAEADAEAAAHRTKVEENRAIPEERVITVPHSRAKQDDTSFGVSLQ
ncbi:hypothetical protein LB553_22650 [Mesorhizobium sp. CA8]|nr:hypothetical protein [Mesorhizobium sp. CA8]